MSEFQRWTSQHRTIRAATDWNALLDHGLEKSASYIIRKNGSYVEAINGSTGKIDYGGQNNAGGVSGTDATTVIQSAINALTDGGMVFVKKGTYTISTTLKLTSEKALVCEKGAVLDYTGSDALIELEGDGITFVFDKLKTSTETGKYGIKNLGAGTSYIDGYMINRFLTAGIWYDATNATANRANSYWNIRWIHCAGVTEYGIKLDSASDRKLEGDRWDIGVILGAKSCGLMIGSDVADSIGYHIFNVDIDPYYGGELYTQHLVEVYDRKNIINLEGAVQAAGDYDVIVHPTADYTVVNPYGFNIRVLLRNLTSTVIHGTYTKPFHYLETFTSLDGIQQDLVGSGSISIDYKEVILKTGTTANSWASILKEPTLWNFSFDEETRFKTRVLVWKNTNQAVWIIVGDRGTSNHFGFKIVNDMLYGTVADGATESTIELKTIVADEIIDLECLFHPNTEARFFVNGSDMGTLSTNLPSGTTNANRILCVQLTNTAAEDKHIHLSIWEFWQER